MAAQYFDVIIVGAGQGGVTVATELHRQGFEGSIAILSSESIQPYELPPLSKGFFSGEQSYADITFKGQDFWDDSPITLKLNSRVIEVDAKTKSLTTEAGETFSYDRLVWATGGRARMLPLPGHELAGVHTVRRLEDALALKSIAETANSAVIIGGGYIGLEAASALRKKSLDVTVIEVQDRLLGRVTSPEISEYFHQLHTSHGVRVLLNTGVAEIVGAADVVSGVRLASGELIDADLVIIGVGIIPNIDALEKAGASTSNGVNVDEFCRTSLPDVWAIGDIASHHNRFAGRTMRVESVNNATAQAKTVVSDLLGTPVPYDTVPWFWSNQYDVKLKTVGILSDDVQVIIRGSIDLHEFSAIYLRNGELVAMDCVNRPKDFVEGRKMLAGSVKLDPAVLCDINRPLRSAILEPIS
ncbi:ferredoxin reductase [Corynebacterium suranareeae]|uniref:Ferredoxin reductase n=1 Tax=Corynebacterium suranareeae TaxID=2506452 RepID=A0A160PMD6_9CORY|nr:FAD-dependent oxidoreductase [Corynebacterium suranareeae]BAU94424.1 ferredoxin reductase [Corynebacterium suranareeae]